VSNVSIISRIREELVAFERQERTADQMERILAAHFEALEGIPYTDLKALHHFEYLLVKAQFSDEDSQIESRDVILERLRRTLDALERKG